jgi:YD repeat-containing protein
LTGVVEDPGGLNSSTTCSHDFRCNLNFVSQSGQTRSFAYSTLGRLTSATNPESGTPSYLYDQNAGCPSGI